MKTSFEEARERLLANMKAMRRASLVNEPPHDLHQAREAIVSVWAQLPKLIDEMVGSADARILTADEMRALLSEFAVDILLVQAQTVERWINSRAHEKEG